MPERKINLDIKGVSIIGTGNVGRRIGEKLSKNFNVIFYDIDKNVINKLKEAGYNATLDIEYAINNSDISFIAVPTPLLCNAKAQLCNAKAQFNKAKVQEKNGFYDMSYLENVSQDIGNSLKNYNYNSNNHNNHIFIIKSTVTPGTTEEIIIPAIQKYSNKLVDLDFYIVYNPEFLTVIQNTWTDNKEFCISPSNEGRIILGEGENKKAGDIVQELYEKTTPNIPILRTNYKTAEMAKLVANNRLALAISFSNEIFLACEKLKENGINIDTNFIIDSVSRDPRIGKYGSIFGKAWGGPCFLKDTVALDTYMKNKINFSKIISNSIEINDIMKEKYGIRE